MIRIILILSLAVGLLGCQTLKQPGTSFEVSHTESSSHGMTYITTLGI